MKEEKYPGKELELFTEAHNWKSYFAKFLHPFLKGHILEAGAGIGGTTSFLCDGSQASWTCLEPDPEFANEIRTKIQSGTLPQICRVLTGTIADTPQGFVFDCILYIDVIEHIEDDRAEIRRAWSNLRPGGHLLILVPAHQFLFSSFDKSIGHFRRYSRKSLAIAVGSDLKYKRLIYLDSAGFAASAANRFIMKKSIPGINEIRFWDRALVPASQILDPLFAWSFGKSVLGIWEKEINETKQ